MRISEITDAQGQLELLRTVIDNTWSAIAQQAENERKAEAARQAQAKPKQRGRKFVKAPPKLAVGPMPKPLPNTAQPPPSAANRTNPNAFGTANAEPMAAAEPNKLTNDRSFKVNSAALKQPQLLNNVPTTAANGAKQRFLNNTSAAKKSK